MSSSGHAVSKAPVLPAFITGTAHGEQRTYHPIGIFVVKSRLDQGNDFCTTGISERFKGSSTHQSLFGGGKHLQQVILNPVMQFCGNFFQFTLVNEQTERICRSCTSFYIVIFIKNLEKDGNELGILTFPQQADSSYSDLRIGSLSSGCAKSSKLVRYQLRQFFQIFQQSVFTSG